MSLPELAPELLAQIFSSLHSITDVLNLTRTCKRLHKLLRTSRRLHILFTAAEREFGPLEDIVRLVTWNGTQSMYGSTESQLQTVAQNFELLKQVLRTGRAAVKIQNIYPTYKWGEDRYLERRSLTAEEEWRVRRAVYRLWLFCEAFHNKAYTRTLRRLPVAVEERSRLLRGWRSEELFEIEDVRLIMEEIISVDLCPTDGMVRRWYNENCDFSAVRWQQNYSTYAHQTKPALIQDLNWNSWPPDRYTASSHMHMFPSSAFHSHNGEQRMREKLNTPVPQRRKMEMLGWGDDINQYYVVQSMLKLNPGQVVHLYEKITTREGIEWYIDSEIGGEWFWDNGQTWTDTWNLVLMRRGWDMTKVEVAIDDGIAGIVGTDQALDDLESAMQLTCDVDGTELNGNLVCL